MKYLLKISPPIWPIFVYEFSLIKKFIKNKKKILLWTCSGNRKKIKFCHANPKMHKIICNACKSKLKNSLDKLNENIEITEDFEKNDKLKIKFNKFYEKNKLLNLEKIKYLNIDIGKGVLSTLYTFYKSEFTKKKINKLSIKLLEEAFYILEEIKILKKKHKINKTILFNGRHYNYRPILRYISNIKGDVVTYDTSNYSNRLILSQNTYPHNLIERSKQILKIKNLNKQTILKTEGLRFFKKRLVENSNNRLLDNYLFSQDNFLPSNFDKKKLNISFFNTSLWEFKSIVENQNLYVFKDDFEFLDFIYEKFSTNKDIFFYFRCHPNMLLEKNYLEKIKKKCNKFKNLLFINPESTISTKELLKHSDIIINFGSSVALEGAFFGKKIITLAPSIFLHFKFQKVIKSKKVLYKYISLILKLKKNHQLYFDRKVYNNALIAAGAASLEGKKFNSVKIIDRYKQIYLYKNKKINLKPSFIQNMIFNFYIILKTIKKLIIFTNLDYNLTLKKLVIFKNRTIKILKNE